MKNLEGIVSKSFKLISSGVGLLTLSVATTSVAGFTPLMLAAGFNIGNMVEKGKVTFKNSSSETKTGLITGLIHEYVYSTLKKIPSDSISNVFLKGSSVLAYSIPYIAITKGLKYLTKNYSWFETANRPYHTIKDTIKNGFVGYTETLADVWKKMGGPLFVNINLTPSQYQIPVSVGLSAWYRRIQGKH